MALLLGEPLVAPVPTHDPSVVILPASSWVRQTGGRMVRAKGYYANWRAVIAPAHILACQRRRDLEVYHIGHMLLH